jgi:cell division protein FtsA
MLSRNIKVGIDIGTYQVKVVICESVYENNKKTFKIIGTGLSESKGLRHGYIINVDDVKEAVLTAISRAEKNSGVKVTEALISIGGESLQSFSSVGQSIVSRADLEITELDVNKAMESAEENIDKAYIQNRKILHTIPLSYKIDNKVVLGNKPAGMKGAKLEVKCLYITCMEQHFADIVEAVEGANIDVLDVLASPIVASTVVLTKSQKIAGCVLVNIGAETISIVVFEDNNPISLEVFPIGSSDVTNDIALGLKISIEDAEGIKKGAITQTNVSKKKLDEIIQARVYDMFEIIESHLKKIGKNAILPAGIFITGGGSNIASIEELARATLKLPSRIASLNLNDRGKIMDSTWSVAYGLTVIGLSGLDSSDFNQNFGKGLFKKYLKPILSWFKQFLP